MAIRGLAWLSTSQASMPPGLVTRLMSMALSRGCGKRREERKCSGKPKALPGERAQKPPLTHGVYDLPGCGTWTGCSPRLV